MRKEIKLLVIVGTTGGILLMAIYGITAKFLRDRESLLLRPKRPHQPVTLPARNSAQLPVHPTNPQTDAVQRSLRTLEEIQRINENNRRLMEQQQRQRP